MINSGYLDLHLKWNCKEIVSIFYPANKIAKLEPDESQICCKRITGGRMDIAFFAVPAIGRMWSHSGPKAER